MIIYKTCTLCYQEKVRGCFSKHRSFPDGFHNRCKKCARVTKNSKKYRDIIFTRTQKVGFGHESI